TAERDVGERRAVLLALRTEPIGIEQIRIVELPGVAMGDRRRHPAPGTLADDVAPGLEVGEDPAKKDEEGRVKSEDFLDRSFAGRQSRQAVASDWLGRVEFFP